MKKQICVEGSIAEQLREFLDREKIDIDIVSGQEADMKIIQCDDHREGNLDILYSGGWITCEIAPSPLQKI